MSNPTDKESINEEWFLRTINAILRTYEAMPEIEYHIMWEILRMLKDFIEPFQDIKP